MVSAQDAILFSIEFAQSIQHEIDNSNIVQAVLPDLSETFNSLSQ